jgi:hypothetical protein
MTNEGGERTQYDHEWFNEKTTRGVVLVDATGPIGRLHYDTLRLAAEAPHPIAVMTRQDFEVLLTEADTVADLGIYLQDRHAFLNEVFFDDPKPFLQLGDRLEQELVGLYKLNDNHFDAAAWKDCLEKRFWYRYQIMRREDIDLRDAENRASQLFDNLISVVRTNNKTTSPTIQHAWELAAKTRRERAMINAVIQRKYDQLFETGNDQQFAVKNSTECWDVFYLHKGLDSEFFHAETQRMADRKMWAERADNDFKHTQCLASGFAILPWALAI